MPSTHLALAYHVVFSTHERFPFIIDDLRPDLHAYLAGCLKNAGCVPMECGGVADHVHLLFSAPATIELAKVVGDVKRASSLWMKEEKKVEKFAWQTGYGAFTVSSSQLEVVKRYIRNQEEHHRTRSFRDEYLEFLEKTGVDYRPEHLW